MTTYRLWPSTNGGSLASYSGPFVGATEFAVSGGGNWLNGYYIWVPTSGDTSPSGGYNTALWSLITGASSGSGVLVPGSVVTGVTGLTANAWNFIPLSVPIQLAAGWDSNATGNGSTYVAAVGWTASAGFADTNGYWASGGGGGNGITNGPLIGYSSNTGASNKAPYGMAQGLFGDSTSNAASALPNQVSGTDNFWVDVQVSDTAPAGYTGSYRLWPDKYDANDFTTGDAAVNYTIATEISLAQACTLNYVWYWSPTSLNGSSAATTLATQCDVWNISTGLSVATIASPSWLTPSGGAASAGTGWVKAAFAGGTTLGTGDYRVSVYNSAGHTDANWSAKDASTDYWGETLTGTVGAAGITWGPVSAPDYAASQGGFVFSNGATGPPPNAGSATSHAQSVFYQPSTTSGAVGFPQLYAPVGGGSNQSQNYWVDLEVTLPVPVSLGGVLGWAAVGEAYSETLTATGGTGPYTYAVTSGSLPGWASLGSSTGIISGTPSSTAGPVSFTVTATDTLSATGSGPFSLTAGTNAQGTGPGVGSRLVSRRFIDGNLGTSATSPAATDAGQWLAFPATSAAYTATAAVTETAGLSASVSHGANLAAALTGTTVLSAAVSHGTTLAAALTETAGLSAAAQRSVPAAAAVTVTAGLSAAALNAGVTTAALTVTAGLSATATVTPAGSGAALTVTTGLTAAAQYGADATAAVTVTTGLTAAVQYGAHATAALTATAGLSAAAQYGTHDTAALTVTTGLSATAALATSITAGLTITAGLSAAVSTRSTGGPGTVQISDTATAAATVGDRLAETVTITDQPAGTITISDRLADNVSIADQATGTVTIGDQLP